MTRKKKPLIQLSIYLCGYELDPDHISKKLGIEPSESQKKGGFKPGSTKFLAKIGIWALKTKGRSRAISDLLDELFKMIGNPPTPLNELDGVEDAHLDMFFGLDDEDGTKETIEFTLTKSEIARINHLGLSLCVTVM